MGEHKRPKVHPLAPVTDATQQAAMQAAHRPLAEAAAAALAGQRPLLMLDPADVLRPWTFAVAVCVERDLAGLPPSDLKARIQAAVREGCVVIFGTRARIAGMMVDAPHARRDVLERNPSGAVLVTIRGDEVVVWPATLEVPS